MSKKIFDVCHGTKYTSNGQEKTRWSNIGVVFESDSGKISMKLEMIPLGIDPIKGLWLNLFPPKDKTPAPTGESSATQQYDENGVPF